MAVIVQVAIFALAVTIVKSRVFVDKHHYQYQLDAGNLPNIFFDVLNPLGIDRSPDYSYGLLGMKPNTNLNSNNQDSSAEIGNSLNTINSNEKQNYSQGESAIQGNYSRNNIKSNSDVKSFLAPGLLEEGWSIQVSHQKSKPLEGDALSSQSSVLQPASKELGLSFDHRAHQRSIGAEYISHEKQDDPDNKDASKVPGKDADDNMKRNRFKANTNDNQQNIHPLQGPIIQNSSDTQRIKPQKCTYIYTDKGSSVRENLTPTKFLDDVNKRKEQNDISVHEIQPQNLLNYRPDVSQSSSYPYVAPINNGTSLSESISVPAVQPMDNVAITPIMMNTQDNRQQSQFFNHAIGVFVNVYNVNPQNSIISNGVSYSNVIANPLSETVGTYTYMTVINNDNRLGGRANNEAFYSIPSSPQSYYTIQLNNGQTILVPASNNRIVESISNQINLVKETNVGQNYSPIKYIPEYNQNLVTGQIIEQQETQVPINNQFV